MAKIQIAFEQFVNSIPASKLQVAGFRTSTGLVHSDSNFRLDMQGMTGKQAKFNLQVQANREATEKAVAKLAGNSTGKTTVSTLVIDASSSLTPEQVRAAIKQKYVAYGSAVQL